MNLPIAMRYWPTAMVVPCRLGMCVAGHVPWVRGILVCIRSLRSKPDNRCDPHPAPARPRWARSNQIRESRSTGFRFLRVGRTPWVWPGWRDGWCMGISHCELVYPPVCCPQFWSVNAVQPQVQVPSLRDTTRVLPSLPVQVQLISLPQRAGQSGQCGRRDLEAHHSYGQSPRVAAAVVRPRFVGDCTPEASRSCASMASGSSAPCACACTCTYACTCVCLSLR